MGNAVLGNDHAADDGLQHAEVPEVFDKDEVGAVTGAEEAVVEPVMKDGVDAGGAQDFEDVDPFCDGAGAEPVDMAGDEIVGVTVVGTQHDLIGIIVQQPDKRFEVPGGAPLADQDLHPGLEFVEGLSSAVVPIRGPC